MSSVLLVYLYEQKVNYIRWYTHRLRTARTTHDLPFFYVSKRWNKLLSERKN